MASEGHGKANTAELIAHYRSVASSDPILSEICKDPYAKFFCGKGSELAASLNTSKGSIVDMNVWVAVRTAFFDRIVSLSIESGVKQVVLLGAGFDTRSNRLASSGVVFFEVDNPLVQQVKIQSCNKVAVQVPSFNPSASVYVPCDFEKENFCDCLLKKQFQIDAPTLFIWEGVIYYLSEAAARATLKSISSICSHNSKSLLAFDYFSKTSVFGGPSKGSQDVLKGEGEPMLFGMNHVLPVLFDTGYSFVVHHDFDELAANYLKQHVYSRMHKFQSVAVCAPRPPLHSWLKLWCKM